MIPIEMLLLTGIFFMVITIGIIMMVVSLRNFTVKRDEYYSSKMKEMRDELSDIRLLFNNDISNVFSQIKEIIK